MLKISLPLENQLLIPVTCNSTALLASYHQLGPFLFFLGLPRRLTPPKFVAEEVVVDGGVTAGAGGTGADHWKDPSERMQ